MNRILYLTILCVVTCLLLSGLVMAKPKPKKKPVADNRKEITMVLQTQQQSWNEGNLEAYMGGYWKSDSLTFVGKRGVTRGWNNTLDNYKKSYPDKEAMGKLSLQIISIKLLTADMGFVVGKWDLSRVAGNVGGHFSLLMRKIKGKWVIVADHSS